MTKPSMNVYKCSATSVRSPLQPFGSRICRRADVTARLCFRGRRRGLDNYRNSKDFPAACSLLVRRAVPGDGAGSHSAVNSRSVSSTWPCGLSMACGLSRGGGIPCRKASPRSSPAHVLWTAIHRPRLQGLPRGDPRVHEQDPSREVRERCFAMFSVSSLGLCAPREGWEGGAGGRAWRAALPQSPTVLLAPWGAMA